MTLLQNRQELLNGSDAKLLSFCFYIVFKNIKRTKLLKKMLSHCF